MIDCPRCGTANPEGSRFCNSCGQSLVSRVDVHERRVVTALFADLARSTSMGERLDPEIVRGLVGQFFELATNEIEARGGTVEKFSGDAVMAVFGIPQAHEDDPERAVRAAVAIRDGLAAAAADANARHGIELRVRIGIEAGEVVVGDPFSGATMATGDAMNLAARLEQQAEPGEIVIGETVHEAVRDLVSAEPLGEQNIRGREAPLKAWRVTAISSEVGRPRGVPGLEAPLTGRDEELHMLLDAGRRAKNEKKAALFTIFGVPGVGKSRLVREATAVLEKDGWSVVRGRCLPYGEGITYWPVADMVRGLAGIDADTSASEAHALLRAMAPDAEVADRLAMTVGAADPAQADQGAVAVAVAGDREIAWGFRRLVEHLSEARGPLVLIFEDIHWAEPPLLDLIEYLVVYARDAPLLVICPSRPELLDTRPAWGSGRMEASRIQLEPLTEAESRSMLGALLTVEDLPADLRQRVLDRAEGNPLYVEEVVRMLIEEGVVERVGDHWRANQQASEVRVPDSVEALIRARLDTLPTQERATLQAASVVGRIFQRSAVVALSPGDSRGPVERHLEEAVLRDLITEERAPDEPTFRFRHILIRDVAYATLTKARRSELHRAVAAWLRAWAGERIEEFVEIEAYHLEQAVQLQRELEGTADPVERDQAVAALTLSARRAIARDDARASRGFAERALALEPPPGEERMELEWLHIDAVRRLGFYQLTGELAATLEVEAEAAGRKDLQGRAVLARAGDIWLRLESADPEGAQRELARARELLTESNDGYYLISALELIGYGGWWDGDLARAERIWTEMREVARSNGWVNREAEALVLIGKSLGQRGLNEKWRETLSEALALAERGSSRLTRARVERSYGSMMMLTESAARGEELLRSAAVVLAEFGDKTELHIAYAHQGDIRARADDWAAALSLYEQSLEAVGDHAGFRPESLRHMANALIELGRLDEAEPVAVEAVETTVKDDFATEGSTRMVLGMLREAQGRLDEAEALLLESIEILEPTDFQHWEEEQAMAELLLRQGRAEEGREWLARALAKTTARLGPNSPVIEYVARRGARAAAQGGVTL